MKRFLLCLLLSAVSGFGAITERYVRNSAAGDGTGSSEANAMSFTDFVDYMTAAGTFNAVAGDRFNVKVDGTYARTTTTDTWANDGTATSPIIVRGYSSAITDGYQGHDATGDLITTNFPVITYTTGRLTANGCQFLVIENLNVTSAADAIGVQVGTQSVIQRCKVINSGTGSSAYAMSVTNAQSLAFDCDALLTGASGGVAAVQNNSTGVVDSCRIKVTSATAAGMTIQSSAVAILNTIYGSGGIGIHMNISTGLVYIRSNTIVGCGGDGIKIVTGATQTQRIIGNIITDNTGAGIEMTATTSAAFLAYNRLRDNASSIANGGDWITGTSYGQAALDTGTTGDTSTDYTNYAGNVFTLKATSPATSASIPASASVGALQRLQTSSGGEDNHGSAQ